MKRQLKKKQIKKKKSKSKLVNKKKSKSKLVKKKSKTQNKNNFLKKLNEDFDKLKKAISEFFSQDPVKPRSQNYRILINKKTSKKKKSKKKNNLRKRVKVKKSKVRGRK